MRPCRWRFLGRLATAGALTVAPVVAAAQTTVSGWVTEEGSGAPIDAAELVFVDSLGGPAGLPPQFNINAMCGVIVVWTR